MGSYLSLTDYAVKHQVSISTLRRKIKAKQVEFKLEAGRYLILDESGNTKGTFHGSHRPSQVVMSPDTMKGALEIIEQKNRIITDLKAEVVDLETLVQVLEDEIRKISKATNLYRQQPHL